MSQRIRFFANRDDAESALFRAVEQGLPRERINIYEIDSVTLAPVPKTDNDAVLKNVLVEGAIGTAVGAGIDELAEVAANVSLFDARLLLAPFCDSGLGCQPRWLAWRHRRRCN